MILRGVTPDQYAAVRAEARRTEEAPEGGLAHLAWREGDVNHNVDAWESESAFEAFGEHRPGQAMAKLGIDVTPEVAFHPAHEVFLPRAITIT